MRFKTFIQERLLDRDINDLQNIIAGAAEKDVTHKEKVKDGYLFSITGLGSWAVFKKVFVEAMDSHGWENLSKDATNLCLKSKKITLWIKYEKNTASFFITDKKLDTPTWDEDTKTEPAVSSDKDSEDK